MSDEGRHRLPRRSGLQLTSRDDRGTAHFHPGVAAIELPAGAGW